ncbi:hypothetical protein TWF506_001310 [Arthrobotrys conoides]|uniref:HhH-GPD domain-containing protein n=1 Tax=Arthrobotrys conoides TaxID=74498 RepID=A0AAN8NXS7_9PEZI
MSRQLRSATKPAPNLTFHDADTSTIPIPTTSPKTNTSTPNSKRKSKRKAPDANLESPEDIQNPPKFTSKKKKLSLKTSPFPTHPFPTPSQCQEVHSLLTAAHGPAVRPDTLTASTLHAGCGEVPSVLDSLLRTVLSANTSARNSTNAFHGLIKKYGHDPVHGGVNWSSVHKSDVKDLYKAIEKGGLANIKSKAIKGILEEVCEDTKKRGGKNGEISLDYLHEKGDDEVMETLMGFKGVGVKTATCVLMFCLRRSAFPVDTHVFRISKLLGWVPTPGYQRELMSQQSKIAPLELTDEEEGAAGEEDEGDDSKNGQAESSDRVDSKTLDSGAGGSYRNGNKRLRPVKLKRGGGKEVKVTRDTTFLHLDARVPDELKYGLHQLMIRHGRYCPTCNAAGGRKYGIGQSGKTLIATKKSVIIKEENADGTFEESIVEVVVKEEPADSDDDMLQDATTTNAGDNDAAKIKIEDQDGLASELKGKPYVPIDAAGGTGEKTGGNPDGSCILGELVSWERLV